MLNGRNFVIDTFSDVYELIKGWRDHEFWDLASHELIPNSIYVIGRKQFLENRDKVVEMIHSPDYCVVFDNCAEGSRTQVGHLAALRVDRYAREGKFLIITGGEIGPEYKFITHEHFLTCILDYQENLHAIKHIEDIFAQRAKPYKFLFLNGRGRAHRKFLWEKFKASGLLDSALWTMLDGRPCPNRDFVLLQDDMDLMATRTEIRSLPPEYEYADYRESSIHTNTPQRSFVKTQLFKDTWGEIYLEPKPYIDTYFSLVTETVHDSIYSFRTEKIAKVLAQGHPWICAANENFYRDIKNMGFRTFHGIIDESFDSIPNHQSRMEKIAEIVQDLCQQDLASFLDACKDICKYNQQHLQE